MPSAVPMSCRLDEAGYQSDLMANFTPVSAAIGGGLIGLSAALLMPLTCARALSHLSLVCVSLSRREFGCPGGRPPYHRIAETRRA